MDCPQCGTNNEDTASLCRQCGLDLDRYLGRRETPIGRPTTPPPGGTTPTGPKPSGTLIGTQPSPPPGFMEYDPARRPSQPRPMSQYVPPPNYPNYRGWAITVVWALPAGILALIFSFLVDAGLARGNAPMAWRYSQLTKVCCWIASATGIAAFVGLFYWLLAWIRDFWPY